MRPWFAATTAPGQGKVPKCGLDKAHDGAGVLALRKWGTHHNENIVSRVRYVVAVGLLLSTFSWVNQAGATGRGKPCDLLSTSEVALLLGGRPVVKHPAVNECSYEYQTAGPLLDLTLLSGSSAWKRYRELINPKYKVPMPLPRGRTITEEKPHLLHFGRTLALYTGPFSRLGISRVSIEAPSGRFIIKVSVLGSTMVVTLGKRAMADALRRL